MPTRTPSWESPAALWRSMACCMEMAHLEAATALSKTTINPSPRFLTSSPPVSATPPEGSQNGGGAISAALVPQALQERAGSGQVREQQGYNLGCRGVPPLFQAQDRTPGTRSPFVVYQLASRSPMVLGPRAPH